MTDARPPSYRVLLEADGLLFVDKAAGVLTVGHGGRERCLLDDLRRDGHAVLPVHRLDRDTSGVLLLVLDRSLREPVEQAFRGRQVSKEYLALVHGRPVPARATIDVPIADRGASAEVSRRGRRAVTRYEVREDLTGPGLTASLLAAWPETGRHNQVRVHLAHVGHALLGDDKFGQRSRGGTRLARRAMLHAARLVLRHPASGATLDVRAPLPADFEDLLAQLRAAR